MYFSKIGLDFSHVNIKRLCCTMIIGQSLNMLITFQKFTVFLNQFETKIKKEIISSSQE
jgi:hypothetical protein